MWQVLATVYAPLLKAQEDWGKCKPDVSEELFESIGSLHKMLGEAVVNVKTGVRLEPPDSNRSDIPASPIDDSGKVFATAACPHRHVRAAVV